MEVVKRNELHTFVVLPKRWVVERSFAWLEKCRRLWKNCERKLNTSLHGGAYLHGANPKKIVNRFLELFPASYADVAAACRDRYPGFRQNQKFNATMKCVNEDANCAHERRLDPKNPKSAKKRYYNLESTMTKLDAEYDHPH